VVYRIRRRGETLYLRLGHPAHRDRALLEAELDFLDHLGASGVAVAAPVAARDGARIVEVAAPGCGPLLATCFREAPGVRVAPGTPAWTPAFFRAWGRALGRIHAAARSHAPRGPERRWHWADEDLVAHAGAYLAGDDRSLEEFARVRAAIAALPEDPERAGLIHADFGPQNFAWDLRQGITAFDFGNCCYHRYVADLAIALSTVRALPGRNRIRDAILDGYAGESTLRADDLDAIEWLLRLRVLYVLLSRLKAFGPHPSAAEHAILDRMRDAVHAARGW
jgi:Ser/Thr protein kinase RdoA (MazF antagonist)